MKFFCSFYRMDEIPNQISVPLQILVQTGVHEQVDPYVWLFVTKAWISTELFLFWTNALSYDKISFCFHALLYITESFRTSYDRNGSILLLLLLILSILMVFQTHSFFGSVFLMMMSAVYFKPIEAFILLNIWKSYWDWMIAYFVCEDCEKLTKGITSRFSDFIFIVVFVTSHILRTYSHPHNTKEDIILVAILIGHIMVFFLRLYTKEYFCVMLTLTLFWMHLKSCKFARIRSLLTE